MIQIILPISWSDLHLLLFSQIFTKFISNLSIPQNLPHIPPTIFQTQNDCILWPNLLLFYPTNMKRNRRTGNWSHIIISQEWISSRFHKHHCKIKLIVIWCYHERSHSNLKWNQISQLMIKDEMEDNLIFRYLNKERWMLIWEVVRDKSTISKLQHISFIHPIINWKEIMKFILLDLEHSLLLLLPTKTKQPPNVHFPNLKNSKPQDEEEPIHAKILEYHPINWSSNLSSRIDVGWIDFIFQFFQWSI